MDTVEVDFDSKTATITMKDGKALSKDAINKAFKDSQFSCTKLEKARAEDKDQDEDAEE